MLRLDRIARLVTAAQWTRLIEEVLANGRPAGLEIHRRLLEPANREPAALGLALQRVVELSWAAEPIGCAIADRLRSLQRSDGSIGGPPATAVALRGLIDLLDQPGLGPAERPIRLAAHRANTRLSEVFSRGGGDRIDRAIHRWQLASPHALRAQALHAQPPSEQDHAPAAEALAAV